jgi:hypothetical protein
MATASSPRRELTSIELIRYLDYRSEALSLSSKHAALHVQYVNDPVMPDGVNDRGARVRLRKPDLEKIVILDTTAVSTVRSPVTA